MVFALVTGTNGAQAAGGSSSTSANININLPVVSPTCTLANSATEINMPAASSTITVTQYLSQNGFVSSPVNSRIILSSLEQTTTFSCDTPNTPILSFLVQPAAGAVPYLNGHDAYLLDAAATPAKAANGGLVVGYEQATINGQSAPFGYDNGNWGPRPYTTTFYTSSTLTNGQSVATVQWYPDYLNLSGNNQMGTPTGGVFSSPATITVTY